MPIYNQTQENGFMGQASRNMYGMNPRYAMDAASGLAWDVIAKGGANHLGDGLLLPLIPFAGKYSHPMRAFGSTYKLAKPQMANLAVDFGISAFKAAQAPRGQKLSTGIASVMAGTLAFIPGALAGGPIGGALTESLFSAPLERIIKSSIDKSIGLGRYYNTTHFGGDYVDTQAAYTMRQRAAREIGQGMMNARQHLGNEAFLYHQ